VLRQHASGCLANVTSGHGAAQDIAAIEARNNRLERQARHNARLQASLEALLERLTLPERTERAMAHAPFTADTCAALPSFLLALLSHLGSA